jgi:hypothetical protein
LWRRAIIISLLLGVLIVAVIEVPDWYRTVALIGVDSSGDPHVVLLDSAGNIVAVMKGDDSGTLRSIKVDSTGQMYTLIKGSGGENIAVDAAGNLSALMKGIEGATLRTVAVDASGNIVAVIKGDYAGTLKTLATDDDGRLLIVPYDPDDIWGEAIAMGNAELAACITVAHRFDRRGNVVFMDDFGTGYSNWIGAFSGTGGANTVSAITSRSGSYSILLTTGKVAGGNASLSKYWPRSSTGRLGFEVSFAPTTDNPTFRIDFRHYDGAKYHIFSVRYDYPNDKLQYLDDAAAWQDVATSLAFYPNRTSFNTIKVVCDLSDNTYERVMMNDAEYDLSGIDTKEVVSVTAPYLSLVVLADGDASNNYLVYVDDVILTQNEPAN